jgi:hypothetical protein
LHHAVCSTLGMAEYADTGSFPDVLEQLVEVKLQTAATIDLGLVSPDDSTPLELFPRVRHCDVRYVVFYGEVLASAVRLDHLVVPSRSDVMSDEGVKQFGFGAF